MLVYGCLPDIAPSRYREFADIPYLAPKDLDKVDSFFQGITVKYDNVAETHFRGPAAKGKFGRGLRQKLWNREILTADFYSRGLDFARARFKGMIRSKAEYNLMVGRGCLGKCTYCAIRHSIGRVQSKPLDAIVEELRSGGERRLSPVRHHGRRSRLLWPGHRVGFSNSSRAAYPGDGSPDRRRRRRVRQWQSADRESS